MTLSAGIIIGMLSLMLVVLGWLVNKIWSDSKDNNKRIYDQIDLLNGHVMRLGDSITGLNGIILSLTEKFSGNERLCVNKHSNIDEKINNHERRITEHGKEIDHIKLTIKKLNGNLQ
jgi:predicted  nucleic acid-binding Zn-ribbon protein